MGGIVLVLLALLMLSCLPKSTVPYVKFYTVPRDTFFAYGFFNGHTMCFSLCISVFYVMHNKQYIYVLKGDLCGHSDDGVLEETRRLPPKNSEKNPPSPKGRLMMLLQNSASSVD